MLLLLLNLASNCRPSHMISNEYVLVVKFQNLTTDRHFRLKCNILRPTLKVMMFNINY